MTDRTPIESIERKMGDFIVREHRLNAGQILDTDIHPYDHLSVLLYGSVVLECNGDRRVLVGPQFVEIKAGIAHRIEVLTNAGWDCVMNFHDVAKAEAA